MRINVLDEADVEIGKGKEPKVVAVKVDNAYCRCCGSYSDTIRLRSTNPTKSKGLTDLLYIARIAKKNILICPRCLASKPVLLKNGGHAVMVYDNDEQKYISDTKLINKTKDVVDLSDFDY